VFGARNAAGLVCVAALLGLAAALIGYFHRGSGIDHTAGALLVIISTALLVAAEAALALFLDAPRWLRVVLLTLCLLGLLGTAIAAWFLHAWWLLAFMLVGLLAWLIEVAPHPAADSRSRA
jgi:hypothetical protein